MRYNFPMPTPKSTQLFKELAFTVYAVTDIKKSRAFYEGILGLVPNDDFPAKEGSMWIEYNIGPGSLSIGCSPDWKPSSDGAVAALEAIDFDTVMQKLKAAKVPFKLEPQDFPTCKMAVVFDPDRNCLLIHQRK
jgi:catechol 2,3-dioxygenase-like lactoylglutathione lyase family enzyme